MKMKVAYRSDVGLVRTENEDSLFVDEGTGLFIVADGVGGEAAGKMASHTAVVEIASVLKNIKKDREKRILEALFKAHERILTLVKEDPSLTGMCTTVIVALCQNDCIHVAHVGDSRAYLIQESTKLLTEDHSIVNQLVKSGKMTVEEARYHSLRNIITQALGGPSPLIPDYNTFSWGRGDHLLLCSDGLSDMVEDSKIGKIVLEKTSIEEKCEKLIAAAKENGGKDNISVILVYRD